MVFVTFDTVRQFDGSEWRSEWTLYLNKTRQTPSKKLPKHTCRKEGGGLEPPPTGLAMVKTRYFLGSPSTLANLTRLKQYLTLWPLGYGPEGSHPISACFLPFFTSHTKARLSFEMVAIFVLSGLKKKEGKCRILVTDLEKNTVQFNHHQIMYNRQL